MSTQDQGRPCRRVWRALALAWTAAGLMQAAVAATAPVADAPSAKAPRSTKGAKALPAQEPAARPAQPQPQFVREMGGIHEYRLPNGLQILLFPDESQTTTMVNVTYRVGSRHEAPGEFGMAHLLEHMLFKGTPTLRDLPEEFARRGVQFNGTTTTDRTNYFASFNASDETLQWLLAAEADRMVNSLIAKADLDKEMSVVRNEFERGENNPGQVLSQRVQAVAYDWHPYGHVTIGAQSDIEHLPIERLQAFYRRYYRPDNATLLVAGRFEPAAVLAQATRLFGPIARPAEPLPRPYTVEPPQDGERSVTVRRVGGTPMLMARYHVPALAHPDSAPLMLLGMMMTMQPSGLLYKELVEPQLAGMAGMGGLGGADPGGITAVAVVAPGADPAKVEQRLLDVVEGRGAPALSEAEIARVREIAVLAYRQQMKSPQVLIQQVSGLLGAGDWRLMFQLLEDLPHVTLADVERVRKAYLRPANRTLGRFLPAREVERVEIPAAPPVEDRLARLQGPPRLEEGEHLLPTPENLQARTVARRLPSGIALQTLEKKTRGNTVQLQLRLRWGERRETFAQPGTDLPGRLLLEGAEGLDKQALQDQLIRLKALLSFDSGDQGVVMNLAAERDTVLDALALAARLLRQPLLPQPAFERMQNVALGQLKASREELGGLADEAVRAHYNQARGLDFGDPDYLQGVDDRITQLHRTRLEDLRAFHARYWSADDAQVAVVGALPPGLDEALERLLGDWKKPQAPRFVREPRVYKPVPGAHFEARAKDKPSALLRLQQDLALNDADDDALALALAVQVLGGGGLENRLATRVRRQEGLSYGISAELRVPQFGNAARLLISGSYAPQARDRILALVRDELRKMGEQGITEAELARARTGLLEGWRRARANDRALAGQLLTLADRGEDWADEQRREAQLAVLTLDQVNAAWRRHVRPDAFVSVVVGDFK
ncbi:insulinase family protein [Pelomonas sp. CA6]|uniref:M16 family metallopeptidase n=1 Tax=Pelomonas sp. CA6 TaxID=2907999 RepID=UPI001F4C16F1|nr:M16 family metallopeptidase [Pelomonas sp. CA6]MCH7343856.1 insulinase family protein [Pelomonas sp. CA6]